MLHPDPQPSAQALRKQHAADVIEALARYIDRGGTFRFESDGEAPVISITFTLQDAPTYQSLLSELMTQHIPTGPLEGYPGSDGAASSDGGY